MCMREDRYLRNIPPTKIYKIGYSILMTSTIFISYLAVISILNYRLLNFSKILSIKLN